MDKNFNRIFYIGILVFSAVFLFFGNRIASRGWDGAATTYGVVHSATVYEVLDIDRHSHYIGGGFYLENTFITFYADIDRDLRVEATQGISNIAQVHQREVAAGDRVLLQYNPFLDTYDFMDFVRIHYMAILLAIFFIAMVVFARKKGANALIALLITCGAIFLVFIPSILSGHNIYMMTMIVAAFSIVTTLFLVIGPNGKAVSAMLGCVGGLVLAGILMVVMDAILGITGLVDHEAAMLLRLPLATPIDLRGIVFAGVIIGSTGAIMDVAMSISSSLWELGGDKKDFKALFAGGLEIGKDILGTMLNTLILAYIGSSLSLILLLTAGATSMLELFNTEMIIVEFLRALVGSFGMLLAVPITATICAMKMKGKISNE
ncbi:MAG: YibE/F family protein [Defluviitaleaceae bacterium]|nr:YibE/F family protein [Defluviitaleaceae bacterium]